MRILVTGGAGYIGSNLVDRLIADGHDVSVVDNLSTGKIANILHLMNHDRFHFVNDTILNEALMDRVISEVDQIYHLAASHTRCTPMHRPGRLPGLPSKWWI